MNSQNEENQSRRNLCYFFGHKDFQNLSVFGFPDVDLIRLFCKFLRNWMIPLPIYRPPFLLLLNILSTKYKTF